MPEQKNSLNVLKLIETKKMLKPQKNILHVTLVFILLFSGTASLEESQNKDLYFRPNGIIKGNLSDASYLYVWPEFLVLLQSKDAAGKYYATTISNHVANELDTIFTVPVNSPISIFRDSKKGHWGLYIRGGADLRESNVQLLDFMVNGFLSCLGVLNTGELDRIKEVIYAPKSLMTENGEFIDIEEQKRITKKMYDAYRNNACSTGTLDDKFIKETIAIYIDYLLTGITKKKFISADELIVWTTLFKDLFFSSHGLWVKAVSANIREFVKIRLKEFPLITDYSWLDHDYGTFIDLILMTYNPKEFTKNRYLNIAKIFDINRFTDLFKECRLKQYTKEGKIEKFYLNIAKERSLLLFLRGDL